MFCPNCGAQCNPDAAFCGKCGSKLTLTEQTVPSAPVSTDTNAVPNEQVILPVTPPVMQSAPTPAAPASPPPVNSLASPVYPPIPPVNPGPSPVWPQPTPAAQPPVQPVKKGTLRVPIIILSVLCVLGLVVFFLFPTDRDENAQLSNPTHSTAPSSPSADKPDGDSGEDIPWLKYDNGAVYFDEARYFGSRELILPETEDGQTVTSIGEFAFSHCGGFSTVILPDTLEAIEYQAFAYCEELRGVFIPEGVTYIGGESFKDCTALEAICIPASAEFLSDDAFYGCTSLRYIFYAGTMEEWQGFFQGELYQNVTIYCSDGTLTPE